MTPTRRRDLRFGLMLTALLAVPTLAGFTLAGSQDLEPPVASTATTSGAITATTTPQVVSDRPVGEAPISAEDALTRQDADTGGFPRLQYNIDGSGDIRLTSGGAIPLGNGLELAVELSPYPANRFDVDIRYQLRRRDGEPIDNAAVDVTWDMSFMPHGPFDTSMAPTGNGMYEASYDFFMFGPWFMDTTLTVPGVPPIDLRLSIYVWPSG